MAQAAASIAGKFLGLRSRLAMGTTVLVVVIVLTPHAQPQVVAENVLQNFSQQILFREASNPLPVSLDGRIVTTGQVRGKHEGVPSVPVGHGESVPLAAQGVA